jgi:hypothetical protein
MLTPVCLGLVLITASPVWSQLTAIPYETPAASADETRMQIPPPMSGTAYPTIVGSEMRSNYMAIGLILDTAYADNVVVDGSAGPISDFIYSILPTIALDKNTPRQQLSLTYSPGFTLYQRASGLDAATQSVALVAGYRLSQHADVTVSDSFQKSSSAFDQLSSFSGNGISGSTQIPSAEVVAPYANRLSNTVNVGLSYQFGKNAMIGAGGNFTQSSYPNPEQAVGLYNSNLGGGSVFYNYRLSSSQYIGATYQYSRNREDPVSAQGSPKNTQTKIQTHAVLASYTIYLNPKLSFSLSCGPQYYDATQSSLAPARSWTPSATASIGWQRSNTNFVASYSRGIGENIGLSGAYNSYSANTSARWRITRTWTLGVSASYFSNKNLTPLLYSSSPGGHSVSGVASVQHSLSDHFSAAIEYARIHQNYNGVGIISDTPDNNQETITISYRLARPLGR